MFKVNKELAKIFEEMGCIYDFLGDENRYRAIAYHNASRVINDLPKDIQNLFDKEKKLEKIPGIGESIEERILEYLKDKKIEKYEKLKDKIPHDFIELLNVAGLGPNTLKTLHNELQVSSKKDLIRVIEDGSALKLKGFKEKKLDHILEGLKHQKEAQERMLLWNALDLSNTLLEKLRMLPEVLKAEVAGSIRRGKETIGDVDLLVAANYEGRETIIHQFIHNEDVEKVLLKGSEKASIIIRSYNKQVDLRIVNPDEWGAALQYFTGSKPHNIHLRKIGIEKGLKLNEYGLFKIKTNKKVAGSTEEEVYKKLGLQYIPPPMREDNGEIELAEKGDIPKLLQMEDIHGDFHTHSNWSDGMNSLEEIAGFISKNFSYEYLVISDHSKSTRIAGGMDEEGFRNQIERIREVNKALGHDLLKAGAEVDILADGSLDLTNDLLEQLDWVTASIHSAFRVDPTERIIKACENPFVNMIGHPTGRIIGSREPYSVDIAKIIDAAHFTGTALEINAHAQRMDLNDTWARKARENGVMLAIGTDSHNSGNYAFMKLGIIISSRAWCTKEQILNTRNWQQIKEFVETKREKVKLTAE